MDMIDLTIEQFNALMSPKVDAKGNKKLMKIDDVPTTLVMQHVNRIPVRYKRVGDSVQVVSGDAKRAFGAQLDTVLKPVDAPKPVASPARNAAMKDLGGAAAKLRPMAKALPSVPGNQLLELEKEQKAYLDAAQPKAPVVPVVDNTPLKDAVKDVIVQKAAPVPQKPAAQVPPPAPVKPVVQKAVTPAPITGRRYQDPVQAALWQARTDALQKYYADSNWGSLGADQLGGVMGSYVNASSHKANGKELVYDASKGEWVDVTPITLGEDKAWRAFAGKDRHDFDKRWNWAWEQAHPATATPTRVEGVDDAAWTKMQEDYATAQKKATEEREAALARQKANTALIAQSTKDDRDMFGPGRTWFGGEPGTSSLKDVIGSLGRPRVVSDTRTKRLIKALSRRF